MTDRLEPVPAALGSAMTPRFGPLVYLAGLGWGLARVRLEDHAAEVVRQARERGPVVYLLSRRSGLDHLALNAALRGTGLPLSAWAAGVRTRWTRPLGDGWQRRGQAGRDPVTSGWVADALRAGHAITLFGADAAANVLVEQLAEQRVQVVPVQIAWNRNPRSASAVVRFFAGQEDRPGVLRRLWRLWRRADVFVQVGEAIDLHQLAERVAVDRLPKILLRIATRTLYRESRLVRGPRLLPRAEMKRRVLEHPPLRELAAREAVAEGVPVSAVMQRLSKQYDRMAARFSWMVIRLLYIVLQPLWTRVFNGVEVRAEDLERIRAAMREGTPILVPCHKSHFDYVLMSWVLFDHDLIVPHVVAGINLAVWPISVFLRGAGGFFIERSFSGQRLFPALFARYLRELILREYTIEFFIEGGRSRNGKLLAPKLGVLSMVLDAAAVRRRGREVTILPIAFNYEQVAEERAYAREVRGRRKRQESIGQFVRATTEVLRRRFGRVYLRVGEPIACGPLVDALEEGDEAARSALLERTGDEIVHRIGQAMLLLPAPAVALGLLAHDRRAIRHEVLEARVARLVGLLIHLGATPVPSAEALAEGYAPTLDRFLAYGWVQAHSTPDGKRVWSMVPDERIRLDYHKNQVMHLLAEASMVVAALHAHAGDGGVVAPEALVGDVAMLRELWRREFVLDPTHDDATVVQRGLAALAFHGAIQRDEAGVAPVPERAGELLALVMPLLEGYAMVLQSQATGADPRALGKAMLGEAEAALEEGRISRPEAVSMETLKNAIGTLRERGAIVAGPDGSLSVDAAAVRRQVERMQAMVSGHE